MATATPVMPSLATTCPMKDPSPYERIILDIEDRPDLKKEVEEATDLLDYVMCRIPDPEDAKYKDDKVMGACIHTFIHYSFLYEKLTNTL